MTAPALPMAAPARSETLRTLATVETARYARHPLFLVGTVLLVLVTALTSEDRSPWVEQSMAPTVFLGLLGVFVGYQLTRSVGRTADAVEAAPADGVTRTAALCLACLLPGAVAVAWWVWMHVAAAVWPLPVTSAYDSLDRAAIWGAGVVCAVGGPLFGVMVGRWTRFPGAGLVAAVGLVAWTMLGTLDFVMPASRLGNLVRLNAPAASWVSSDGRDTALWMAGGSPLWYVTYLTVLCGLAATAAMLHEAFGQQRWRLTRALGLLAVLAVASLALAVADPARVPL